MKFYELQVISVNKFSYITVTSFLIISNIKNEILQVNFANYKPSGYPF